MSDQPSPPGRGSITTRIGVFQELLLRIKLVFRLLGDRRVNPLVKIIPIGSLLYFLVPDLVPGPLDDAGVIWLAGYLFVELCPPEVVKEHLQALYQNVGAGASARPDLHPADDIIDGEYKDIQKE